MLRVIHLIPYDGIGGVEAAARTMRNIEAPDVLFELAYIFAVPLRRPISTFNPLPIVMSVYRILKWKPDILIVSLWRSCIVGILVKIFRPRLRLVLFLHLPRHAHVADALLTNAVRSLASAIWADSVETFARRLPGLAEEKGGKIISFVAQRLQRFGDALLQPTFIFWGRIHSRKGLLRAVKIFSSVRLIYPDASFIIVGPDGGDIKRLSALIKEMGLHDAVSIRGSLDLCDIIRLAQEASFYLQTSEAEGMAMSVVEAMQLGLVPIVTPVGEIANYCRHNRNALIVRCDDDAVSDILSILNDRERYERLRNAAIATWKDAPLYADSVLQACREVR